MNAKVIFINEKEMQATGNQYALASTVSNEHFEEPYIRLKEVLDFIQTSQNAAAEEMIKLHEQVDDNGVPADATAHCAEWRTYNWLLSEFKRFINR